MKRVLSIDFDYFIDTDVETRNNVFPNGVDEKNTTQMIADWFNCYDEFPNVKKIGVIDDFKKVCQFLLKTKKNVVVVRDSHKEIENIFRYEEDKEFLIDHIDFHHDYYLGSEPSKIDCSNWLRIIMNDYPQSKVRWFRREDSEMTSILGDYPYESYTELDLEEGYDYIFVCMSPEWTPLHLNSYYEFITKCALYGLD